MSIYRLENVIQTYAWGSRTAIAELMGQPSPSLHPQAELWMGTHPKGPSMVTMDAMRMPLAALIDQRPADILGADVDRRFGGRLPFLFKVLAAARPLSIQAHPDKRQAALGFARENALGKALDAPERNYRDDNHKPEIICALSRFWSLNGFRAPDVAASLLEPVLPAVLAPAWRDLKSGGDLGAFFRAVLTLPADQRQTAARQVWEMAAPKARSSDVYRWMVELAREYPADMGVLSPALLNLICLEPGQAMYLPAGQLHAYLDGVGIELMANSDNVLRGGLTPKHVDVTELLAVGRFQPSAVEIIRTRPVGPGEWRYDCPAVEFSLGLIRIVDGESYVSPKDRNVQLLLCTEGEGVLTPSDSAGALPLHKGESVMVPAVLAGYRISGHLTIYKATVPPVDQ